MPSSEPQHSAKMLDLIKTAQRRGALRLHLKSLPDSSLPDSLGELTHLQELHIVGCPNLRRLPESITSLKRLAHLSIAYSKIVSLPEDIGHLTALSSLSVNGCPVTALPSSIGKLRQLTQLSVQNCSLRVLPDEIGELAGLRHLALSGNCLESLPDSVSGLRALRRLKINGNRLTRLPDGLGALTGLTHLIVRNNRLNDLPASLRHLRQQVLNLDVAGNPDLGLPAEIVAGKDPHAILDFFSRSARRRRLNEAKILLVGQGGVGKTSLVNRLLDNTFSDTEAKTEGISVRNWTIGAVEPVRLNVWDFGGQEIMHATHQFFLTKRSLYVLVLDARAGEREGNIHYWLEMIRVYGSNSPVLVVLNKSEEHFEGLDEHRLVLDYSNVVNFAGFYNVSCKSGVGILELRKAIAATISKLPHLTDYLPEDYFAVKEDLESLAHEADFLTEDEYVQMCERRGVTEHHDQRRLLRFLHDLGSVLHYDDPDQRYHVHDTRVLNPAWVTGGVYKLLNDASLLRAGDGVVRTRDLRRLLDARRYPEHRYRFLVEVMKKFELCFPFHTDDEGVLVPELLSRNEPDVGWSARSRDVLNFEYHYTVLPRGLLPRFIVRARHLLTDQPTIWRSGAVLGVEGCRVLVRGDLRSAKVFIQVQGPQQIRRSALAVVRDAFGAVHLSYGQLVAEAKVPLPDDPAAPPVDYLHLRKLERARVGSYLFERASRPYDVQELLDGVDERDFDVFLSHSSLDKPQVRTLARLLRSHGIRYWLDEEHLTPGRPWIEEIVNVIDRCHAVAIIVGPNGIGPWENEELALALDSAARGKKRVIPITLPGAPDLRDLHGNMKILTARTWIHVDTEVEADSLGRLVRAIREP